jgi:hypothetical protein
MLDGPRISRGGIPVASDNPSTVTYPCFAAKPFWMIVTTGDIVGFGSWTQNWLSLRVEATTRDAEFDRPARCALMDLPTAGPANLRQRNPPKDQRIPDTPQRF